MKKLNLWLLASLLVATFTLTACSDDDDDNSGGSGVAADNTLVYDGKSYKMITSFGYPNNHMGIMMIESEEKDADGQPLIRAAERLRDIHIYAELVGYEFDLTQPCDLWPGYSFGLEGKVNILFYGNMDGLHGIVEGETYENTSVFKSGKLKVSIEGGNLVYVINGETKNGHTISLRVVTSANGWTPVVE